MIPGLHDRCTRCVGCGVVDLTAEEILVAHPREARVLIAEQINLTAPCRTCRGVGFVDKPGGPRFGALITLTERSPGEVVELVTGQRARIAWHYPRTEPDTTFVAILDDFDDTEHIGRLPFPSGTGVRATYGDAIASQLDDGYRAKAADALDPFTKRAAALPDLLF